MTHTEEAAVTDYVIIADTDEDAPTERPEDGNAPRRFCLYDEMFPSVTVKRVTKVDGKKKTTTWEAVSPNYSVSEVAKFFFALGAHWLRWRYHPSRSDKFPEGYFVLDGERLEEKRTPHGTRYYTLPDVERLAYALAENNVLDGEKLALVIKLLRLEAELHGVES